MTSSHLDDFDAIFPEVLETLTTPDALDPEPPQSMAWFKKVLEYNVPFGKKNRGVSLVTSYRHLVQNPTDEDLKIARVLGWCVELFQAYLLVADDVMDNSETRRGRLCWYKVEGVGLKAVNDALFLEGAVYRLLRRWVRDRKYYLHLTELFLQTAFQTVAGQCLDLCTDPPEGSIDFSHFTMDRCSAIVKWKTAFYSFYLPVATAMHMAGISDQKSHSDAKKILLKMGHFFQIQDDYLDCYGSPEVIGKVGTDIQDNKCSWLVVKALEKASTRQRDILKENYGRWDDACVQRVKDIYRDLDLEGEYRQFEDSSYQELVGLINSLAGTLPKEIFLDYVNRLYKRSK